MLDLEAVVAVERHSADVATILLRRPPANALGLPLIEGLNAALEARPDVERPVDEELIAFARERLAGYETPKEIIWVDELPETVGGKVLKYRLRERYGTRTSLPK